MKDRSRALAVMIAVLLAGCVLGVTGLHFWEAAFGARVGASVTPRVKGQNARLARLLQLSTTQETKLKAILDDSRREIDAGRAEWETKLEAIRTRTNEKITAILNDEQKEQFQQVLAKGDVHKHGSGRGNTAGDQKKGR